MIILLLISIGYAQPPEEKEATKKSIQAILSYPEPRQAGRYVRKKIENTIELNPVVLSAVGAIGSGAINGKVSTNKVKGMNLRVLGVKIRPDVEHNLKEKSTEAKFIFMYDF